MSKDKHTPEWTKTKMCGNCKDGDDEIVLCQSENSAHKGHSMCKSDFCLYWFPKKIVPSALLLVCEEALEYIDDKSEKSLEDFCRITTKLTTAINAVKGKE